MTRPGGMLVLLVLAGVPAGAVAQIDDDGESRFREIQEGFDDLSPQATSLRMHQVDLRQPLGFSRVYQIVDSPGLLARRSGALTAVFSRSVYRSDASAPVPAGTVYYIGDLPVNLGRPGLLSGAERGGAAAGFAGERTGTRLDATQMTSADPADQRVDLRVRPEDREAVRSTPAAQSIWTDEAYRQRRLWDILRGTGARGPESGADAGSPPQVGEDPQSER